MSIKPIRCTISNIQSYPLTSLKLKEGVQVSDRRHRKHNKHKRRQHNHNRHYPHQSHYGPSGRKIKQKQRLKSTTNPIVISLIENEPDSKPVIEPTRSYVHTPLPHLSKVSNSDIRFGMRMFTKRFDIKDDILGDDTEIKITVPRDGSFIRVDVETPFDVRQPEQVASVSKFLTQGEFIQRLRYLSKEFEMNGLIRERNAYGE